MDIIHLETEIASIVEEFLVRVQIPADDVSHIAHQRKLTRFMDKGAIGIAE